MHVLDLAGHPKVIRAFAWSNERDDGKRRVIAVELVPPINTPQDAVRAAAVVEQRAK